MKPLKFTVTQEDVNNGVREDCSACPAALAIIRETGAPPGKVNVDGDHIYLSRDWELSARYKIDEELWECIGKFDRGNDDAFGPLPRTFECEAVELDSTPFDAWDQP
jgi:hypothetical protein